MPEIGQYMEICQKRFLVRTLSKHVFMEPFYPQVLSPVQLTGDITGVHGGQAWLSSIVIQESTPNMDEDTKGKSQKPGRT